MITFCRICSFQGGQGSESPGPQLLREGRSRQDHPHQLGSGGGLREADPGRQRHPLHGEGGPRCQLGHPGRQEFDHR